MKKTLLVLMVVMLILASSSVASAFLTYSFLTAPCYVGETSSSLATIICIGGGRNWSFSASGYPPGCSLKYDFGSSANIVGTPSKPGFYVVTGSIRAETYKYNSSKKKYEWTSDYTSVYGSMTVYPARPEIQVTSPDEGEYKRPYEFEITTEVYGDSSGLSWDITSGDLPAGLSLDQNTGIISGIPEESGDYTFTITVINDVGSVVGASSTSREFTLTINDPVITITKESLNFGITLEPYSDILSVDIDGATWSAKDLPEWLILSADTGELSGTPPASGSYVFTAIAAIGSSYAEKEYTIIITDPDVAITTETLADGTVNVEYSDILYADVSWAKWSASDLPSWLNLDENTGVLSGMPLSADTYLFTVKATAGTKSADKQFTINITGGETTTTDDPENSAPESQSNPGSSAPGSQANPGTSDPSDTANPGTSSPADPYVQNVITNVYTLSNDVPVLWRINGVYEAASVSETKVLWYGSVSASATEDNFTISWIPETAETIPTDKVEITVKTIEGVTPKGDYNFNVQISEDGYNWEEKEVLTFDAENSPDNKDNSSGSSGGGGGGGCNSGFGILGLLALAIMFKRSR